MQLNMKSGRVESVLWLPSPNCDSRLNARYINAIIIHAISLPPSQYGSSYVEDFFCNQLDRAEHPYFNEISSLKVSAHFYIKRTGILVQFVSTKDRAWHAGESCLGKMTAVNDFSIGIELEGCDEDHFTHQQYQTLIELTHCLRKAYPAIRLNTIVGHSDIAPGRKTDPGTHFNWDKYKFSQI